MTKKPLAGQPQRAGERPPAGVPEAEQEPDETKAQRDQRDAEKQLERDLDELGETRRERDEYLELAQRTRADFDNYRKRVAKETTEALSRGKAELARDLIPVVDNLERALAAARPQPQAAPGDEAEEAAPDGLARGVALVLEELRSKLGGAGVETYDPVGERFDPELHEALSTRDEEGTDPGVVVETVEKGYRLNGRVLRPARVVVSE